jgi:hypothetical protein
MALNLANVQTTDTFQTWFTRTNEVIRDSFPTSGGTITGNLTVSGDALFEGNTTIVTKTTIETTDALLHLAANNEYSDILDIGFFAHYFDGIANNHTGIIRDSSTKEYYIFSEFKPGFEPTSDININHASFVLANLHITKLISNTVSTHSVTTSGDITADGDVTAASFIGDGSQLTNAGSTVATDSTNHDLLVPFTGISSGTMTSANVNASFTFNPSTGTLTATAFSGDGSQLTNAGSTVATDSGNHTLFVPFTGINSGTMTSANVNASFTFNPSTGLLESTKVKTSDLQDSSGRTLTIRDEANTVVWGG